MEKSFGTALRKIRGTRMSLAGIWDANASLADALRGFAAKFIAKRAQAAPRTAENWLAGDNGPAWKHTVAMLNDDELCARLLEAAGRSDLARTAEVIAAEKALKAAVARERK